jgi:multidrug transporter EmrE-like cation transporter
MIGTISLVVVAITANALASLLLKNAAVLHVSAGALTSKVLLFGVTALAVYALAFGAYALVLKAMPVSKAYAIITFGAQSVLILTGSYFFGEEYEATTWLGLALVIAGVLLITKSAVTQM